MVQPGSITAPIAVEAAHAESREKVAIVMDTPFVAASPEVVASTISTKLTAYNAVPGQTDNTPFITAVGAFSNPEVVAARSRDLASELPYGTVIAIERTLADTPSCRFSVVEDQIGYRVIADAMNSRIVNTVDVLLDQNAKVPVDGRMVNPGLALGRCASVNIRVVGVIPVSDIPATQEELRAMVEGETELAIR